MTIETICNEALDFVGYKRHIGNIYEGSAASEIALNNFGQLRDALLYRLEPDWARRDAVLTLLKSAPNITGSFANYDVTPWSTAYPPMPWLYEYGLPTDNIKPLAVKQKPLIVPDYRPRAVPFNHRTVSTSQETLLCSIPNAILIYIYRVENPDFWADDFKVMMVQSMAQAFRALSGQPQQREQENADRPN